MKKKIFIPLVLSLLGLLTWQCSFQDDIDKLKDAVDSLQLVITNPEFESTLHLEFVDAKTEKSIVGKKVHIHLKGENAKSLLSNIGAYEDSYTVRYGFIDLVVDSKVVKNLEENPLPVDLLIDAEGYLTFTQRVFLTGEELQTERIMLVKKGNTPEGVIVAEQSNLVTTNSSGKTEKSGVQKLNGDKQEMEIPQGAILKDEDGKAITGKINSEVVFIEAKNSQNVFLDGNNATVKNSDGEVENVTFVSPGTFSIKLTSGGKKVKTIGNGGIRLKTEISSDLINPITEKPVKEGDNIDLYSKDEDSGVWNYEKTSKIKAENGKLYVEDRAEHLSLWVHGWGLSNCWVGSSFTFQSNANCQVVAKIETEGEGVKTKTYNVYNNGFNFPRRLYGCKSNKKTKITFIGSTGNANQKVKITPSVLEIDNLCERGNYDITVNVPAPTEDIIRVKFNLSYKSKNGRIYVRPNGLVFVKQENPTLGYNVLRIKNGKGAIDMKLNEKYRLLSSYHNRIARGTLFIKKINDSQVKVNIGEFNVSDVAEEIKPVEKILDIEEGNVVNVEYHTVLSDDIINKIEK